MQTLGQFRDLIQPIEVAMNNLRLVGAFFRRIWPCLGCGGQVVSEIEAAGMFSLVGIHRVHGIGQPGALLDSLAVGQDFDRIPRMAARGLAGAGGKPAADTPTPV